MINLEIKGLNEFLTKFNNIKVHQTLNRSIKKAIIFLEGQAKRETPVDKGFLRNAYRTGFSDLRGELVNTKKYAIFVHEGTKPHIIRIKNKRVLTNRKTFFGKTVNHPGTKSNPFMTRTANKGERQVNMIFNSEIGKTLNLLK